MALRLTQKSLVIFPETVEHLPIRRSDWVRLRDRLAICRPQSSWLGSAGWASLGSGLGGILSRLALTGATGAQEAMVSTASVCLVVAGVVLLFAYHQAERHALDEVGRLRAEMDTIEADCQVAPVEVQPAAEPIAVRPAERLR